MSKLPSFAESPQFQHTFFNEITIYQQHIKSLLNGAYLTDPIITFYFLYLKERHQSPAMAFINPSLSWMFTMLDEDSLHEQLSFLDLDQQDLVFLPVNDNASVDSSNGGAHWSLLVYHRAHDAFHYYDSAQNHNLTTARRLASKMQKPLRASSSEVVVRKTPQQHNGYDCGVFVCAIANALAEDEGDDQHLLQKVTQEKVTAMRDHILDLIADQLHQ